MSHSVRRVLVDWLQRVVDHLSEKLVKDLGSAEVHPQPGNDIHDRLVVGVDHTGPKGQVYVAVPVPSLGDVVSEHGGSLTVSKRPPFFANSHSPAGLNLINHQQCLSLKNVKNYAATQVGAGALFNLAYHKAKESSGGDK